MKSDEQYLQEMNIGQGRTRNGLCDESAREMELYLAYIRSENIAPHARYFSITKLRHIPLWLIYGGNDGYDTYATYATSAGKLYQFRYIGFIAPASRYEKLHIGEELRRIREAREKQQTVESINKKRRTPWRLVSR